MKRTAFSLVELLVVIVIVVILSSIVVPVYRNHVKKTQFTDAVNMLQECRKQVEITFQETDKFPEKIYDVPPATFVSIGSKAVQQVMYDHDPGEITEAGKKLWCAAILQSGVVPETKGWESRAIHIGATRSNTEKKLVWFCGRWDNTYFNSTDLQNLPPECNTNGVANMLNNVK